MSNLRQQIESALREYVNERYAGDLGEMALNHFPEPNELPAKRRRIGRRMAWSLAIAASLLLAVIVLPDEKPPRKKMPKTTMSIATLNRSRPSLFRQSARLSDRSKRRSQRMSMARHRPDSAWVSPLAFARPKLSESLAATITKSSITDPSPRRRKTLSTPSPSFSLRSLGNVISIGT